MRLIRLIPILYILLITPTNSNNKINCDESISVFNLSKFNSQKYTNYFTNFSTNFRQSFNSDFSSIDLLPLELMEHLQSIDFKELKLSFAFGNPNEILRHPVLGNKDLGFDIPFAGTVFRIDTFGSYSDYFKLIKLFSGLFNSEMKRPMEDYFIVQGNISDDLTTDGYFFHSNGFEILNTNIFIPILKLLNYQNNHKLLSLLDPVNIFTADYISFTLHLQKSNNNIWFDSGINFIHNANSFDYIIQNEGLFIKRFMKSLENSHSSLFINNEWKTEHEFNISYSDLKSMYMSARPILSESKISFSHKPLTLDFFFEKSFVHIQNSLIMEFNNYSKQQMDVNLNLFFSIAEEPILHQIKFEPSDCVPNQFKIFNRPHKSKEGNGGMNLLTSLKINGSKCRITLPYFQKHKNFEDLDSDHLVYYLIPGAFADYYIHGKPYKVSLNFG